METAGQVFDIAAELPIDRTSYNLREIKEIVKRIENKVDVLLDTPLKMAIDYCKSSISNLINKSYPTAFENLKRVLDEAMRAFHHTAAKKKSVKTFKEKVETVKLIIFAQVLISSYDRVNNVFLPQWMLSDNIKRNISDELQSWVEKLIEEKAATKTDSLFSSSKSSEKKMEAQNSLDSVLKVAYSFISHGSNFTSEKNRIEVKDNSIEIRVWPKFVPDGKEDKTEMIIGVRTFKNKSSSFVKIQIWRTQSEIHCLYNLLESAKKFRSDTEVIRMKVNIPSMIVLTGNGTMKRGECLGLYNFDPDHGCYKQVATEEHYDPALRVSRYIYRASDEEWYIGSTPGLTTGWMKNTSKSETLPLTGWMLGDGKQFHSDPSVKIQFGSLSPDQQCGDVRIQLRGAAADKWPKCGGLFTKTDKYTAVHRT